MARLFPFTLFVVLGSKSIRFVEMTETDSTLFGRSPFNGGQIEIHLLVSFLHQVHLPHLGHFNNLLVGVCINKVISL